MRWDEVKQVYPSQWVMIEAIDARSEGNKRIIEQVKVVNTYEDNSKDAIREFVQLHRAYPERELYVIHTSRPELDIEEQRWVGVRASQCN